MKKDTSQFVEKYSFFLWFFGLALIFYGGVLKNEVCSASRPENEQARVIFLQGQAEIFLKGESAGKPLKTGDLIPRESEVRTGEKSRIEITFPDRSVLRFDQRTAFKINRAFFDPQEDSREVKTQISTGRAWANVRKVFSSKKTFEVAAANAVAGVRDTVWRMDIAPDKSTLIRVYEGRVEVYNPFGKPDYKPEEGGFKVPRGVRGPQEVPRPYKEISQEQWEEIVLSQMMQVVIPPVGRPARPVSFNEEEDRQEEWVRWNRQRDQEIKP